MSHSRLAISAIALEALDPQDFKWLTLSDSYLTKVIRHANLLGLEGRKITEILGVQEQFATGQRYIDFRCEP